jgi:DNA-binding CsgD family transcriptional regulator/PAS domain-containing protein
MMAHAERLSELIGDIYDAAIDPALWHDVIGRAGFFVGGQVATIFAKSPVAANGHIYYETGIDPEYRDLYFEKYLKLDPTTAGQYFAEIGQPVAVSDLMPYSEFQETRFYNEWVKPQGMVDFVSAVLDKSATTAAMFGVFRYERDGIADDETKARMRLLAPHVRRAVLIGRLIDLKTAESASFADTLDGMRSGLCMVDGAGRIVHANAACQQILDAGDPLFLLEGRIAARDVRADQALQEVFAASRSGDAAVGTRCIAVSLTAQNGAHHVAHVLPLTSGARRNAGRSYAAAAAIFIRRATLEPVSPPELIARTYRLTPTELRVLLAIVEVGGVPDVATVLGIAETTIKTHLRRVFVKTGSERQADLVKIVAGFGSPLAG